MRNVYSTHWSENILGFRFLNWLMLGGFLWLGEFIYVVESA